jgi:hypothetical protein
MFNAMAFMACSRMTISGIIAWRAGIRIPNTTPVAKE